MVRRRTGTDTVPTWVNVDNIILISAVSDGNGSRISMRECFLLAEEDVAAVMDKIRQAEDDR